MDNTDRMEAPVSGAVCVYGASSSRIDPQFKEAAYAVGSLIARAGRPLVCGGGRGGLMARAIDGALDAGGTAVGVLPRFMVEREWQHLGLTRMFVTDTMHERKAAMASMSSAAIALPGGIGTLEELMEIMTWRQLKLFHGPVVILNTGGYYEPLLQMLSAMTQQGFMRPGEHRLYEVASTPEEAVKLALTQEYES